MCVIIPAYNEAEGITHLIGEVRKYCSHILVVDDGSQDGTGEVAERAGAEVIRHNKNMGKGVSLGDGFAHVRDQRYGLVITMDGDGQHNPADIPQFIETYQRTGIPMVVGNRMADVHEMPFSRRLVNFLMSRILSNVMHQYVPDTQCGFRLLRGDIIPIVMTHSARFAAESEMLLYVADRGIRIGSVRVKTIYNKKKSSIRPFRDTILFIRMLRQYSRQKKRRRRRMAR